MRLQHCANGIAKRVAQDMDALARRQASRGALGGARPTAGSLHEALATFAQRVASAPGTHVQAFLDDSYFSWNEHESALLVRLVAAAEGEDPGWSLFQDFSELTNATTSPWRDRNVENVLTGASSAGLAEDSLKSWLAQGELLPGTLTAIFEALGEGFRARPPCLAELLGAIAQVIGEGVLLRATTTQGVVIASSLPTALDDRLPCASLPPLARSDGRDLFEALREVWAVAAGGTLAEGPIECVALEQDTGALDPMPQEPPSVPCEPFAFAPDPSLSSAFQDLDPSDEAALEALFSHPDPQTRAALLHDRGDLLDVSMWAKLLADPSPSVRAAAVRHEDCPLPMATSERHSGVRASSPHAHPWELSMLAAHAEDSVRATVARNLATPLRALYKLARDPAAEVRRFAVWPLCMATFTGSRSHEVAQRAIDALARDEDIAVRREVGQSIEFLSPKGPQEAFALHINALLADDTESE